LESILRRPEASLAELSMISSEEEALLEAFRGDSAEYDSTATISQLLEEQVSRDPQATAIVCGKHSISYGELGRRVHALAYRLRLEGVEPNVPVALLIPQSIQRFVAIYAVLHAGGAYVPIDPNYPEERIAYILSDSGAKLLLTLDSTQAWDIPCIDIGDESLYEGQHPSLPSVPGPRDLAYCIYTSGTAGKPKGVMVEQISLVGYYWIHQRAKLW
jgi:non-ribosomal peptide synthetase component F